MLKTNQNKKLSEFSKEQLLEDSSLNFKTIIENEGAVIIRNILGTDFISTLKNDLQECIIQDEKKYGKDYVFLGMVHALMTRKKSFRDVMEDKCVHGIMQKILGKGTITHAFNSSSMPPGKSNYAGKLHVDSPRLIPGHLTNMVITIALDPFTDANGAMQIWPKSFNQQYPPEEFDFVNNQITLNNLNAGDAILFNARCWHRGGTNRTENWRHAIALTACRSYMRQQFDFTKMFTEDIEKTFSEDLKQFMGYFVRMPKNMEEFLLPPEKRLYKPGQEDN